MKIETLSSIPGRIRLGIECLKGNSNLALYIENIIEKLSNIQLISINIKTGNILLTYKPYEIDEDKILNFICKFNIKANDLTSITYGRTKLSSEKLFKEETYLSRRLLALSTAIASVLFFSSSPIYAIASLILGFPGIIHITSHLSLKYTLIEASFNNVYVKDTNTVSLVKNIKGIFIHSNLVFNNDKLEKLGSINHFRIESLISTGAVDDPINIDVRKLIRDLRDIGINNINIIPADEKKDLLLYANKSLGLYNIQKNEYPEMIITNENDIKPLKTLDKKIILSLSSYKSFNEESIHIDRHELYKIPWLIKTCMNNQEYLTRSHATAVSINVFGIMLAFMKYISLSESIILYFVNTLGNVLYLKHKTLHHNKEELLYGTETNFSNA